MLPDPQILVLALVALLALAAAAATMLHRQRRHALDQHQPQLDHEVRRRTSQLTELARHLQLAREDERARLARDLHDDLGSLLTSARLETARIRSRLENTAPETLPRVAHLVALLDAMVAVTRRVSADLLPPALAHLGLAAALESLAAEFRQATSVELALALQPAPLSPQAELTVFRLVQEALTNVAKHAAARHVQVSLVTHGDWIEATVTDDGRGCDPSAATDRHGLVGMRFRVEGEGGRLEVSSPGGQGTRVSAWLPRAHTAAPAP